MYAHTMPVRLKSPLGFETTRFTVYHDLMKLIAVGLCALTLGACSMGQMVARSSLPVVESGNVAMNRETDLELARAAIPANLKLIEGLIEELPGNPELRLQAAQGFYGYAYGFVEDEDSARAAALYRRGLGHALKALAHAGLRGDLSALSPDELKQRLDELDRDAVPALFWSASCWAKWIDMSRNDPARLAELGKTAALMQRALELDDTYYYGGAHLFFGVYYGNRPPMLGGDFKRSAEEFTRARTITQGKLLIVDLLQAQYLARQELDRQQFHQLLTEIVHAPPDLYPDMALANAIAQHKAGQLLAKEEEWF
ncbi:MAG TPA: TRAP transporter TatT component family protein [Albitalea sp.]|nr:TRAP transporter TatT component family protein [Albitalea sp.]